MIRDYRCKKVRLSLWMLTYSKTPSSCLNDTPMSRQDEDSSSQTQQPTTSGSMERRNPRPALPVFGTISLIIPGTILVSAVVKC